MPDDHKSDRVEKQIRFGCGFLFGTLLGFFVAVRAAAGTVGVAVPIVAGVAIAGGLLAVRYGDRFWYSLREWLNW